METPIAPLGPSKPEVHKPADRPPTRPATQAGGRAAEPTVDHAAISPRSQSAAARARTDDPPDAGAGRLRVGPRADHLPADAEGAEALARETGRQITVQPEVAARAQANVDGASVVAMLQ